MSHIPLVDLKTQYQRHRKEILDAVDQVFAEAAFIQGSHVERFERSFTERLGAAHGVACANGTAALSLALEALGVGCGDEVITVAHTFFATTEAILHVGATPVFVDVDPVTGTMDPAAAAAAVSPRTRAVVPVHLYGTPAAMDEIAAVCAAHGLFLVEDAAQAHFATYRGRMAGTLGDAGTFSFYPGKNLGAYGDAGFIVLRDAETAFRTRQLRDHGRTSKYEHGTVGYNQRMDGVQGAILSVKLRHMEAWTAVRRAHASAYDARLMPMGYEVIRPPEGVESCYHLYVVQVSNRSDVQKAMAEVGIDTGVHYPVPLHLQPALAHLGVPAGSLPVTERLADRVLSLPLCPELTEAQRERVCQTFLSVARP
ncbi:DegT/DnrJ/EryC1/StrS family aminotransferase [Azospirillum sp.]|uniref:DegT/DnrJ/EryC1/StrS family aminotransferase n=1 Tax=Azospirillum sp. TaxID=34012 RepID=UPI00262AB6CB|nr:DegT/DnrJ/EryC1/StrS family aminotransferase [Azospirillum sp.]